MEPIRVAVVGAGIAGLTVALRLLERGYEVTVYDRKAYVGGKLGAHTHTREDFAKEESFVGGEYRPDRYHEHCYHMFLNWYHNFWNLVEDVGLRREDAFEPRNSVKYMRRGDYPRTMTITHSGSLEDEWANLTSGVRTIPDMFLNYFAVCDMLAQRFESGLLGNYSVNGFVQARPYATEGSATLFQDSLAKAFALPSFLTSARSYQAFLKYSIRRPSPMMWLLKNDVHHGFNEPLKAKLDHLGCQWKLGHHVQDIHVQYHEIIGKPADGVPAGHPIDIVAITSLNPEWPHPPSPDDHAYIPPGAIKPAEDVARYDYVVLAIPPSNLRRFFVDSEFADHFETRSDETVEKLHFEPTASVDLYFKGKLAGIPKEHVILIDSTYGLTFIDNSQLWPGIEGTVLNVASTDFRALANLSENEALEYIVTDLKTYVPFEGEDLASWHIETNAGDKLFVNEIGSDPWRPGPKSRMPNLFLAGDYCRTFIDVVTVEGAVVSGLQAVRALQEQVAVDLGSETAGTKLLEPVTIIKPDAYPQWTMLAATAMLAPYAAAAKIWSWINDNALREGGPNAESALDAPELIQTATNIAWMPWQIAADVWNTAWSSYVNFWGGGAKPPR